MKTEPRKETDRGGYLCMPLCTNVPEGSLDEREFIVQYVGKCTGKDRRTIKLFSSAGLMAQRVLNVR